MVPAAVVLALLLAGCASALPVSFNHGVASGDPLPDGIILWTRIEPRSVMQRNDTAGKAAGYMTRQDQAYNVTWVVSARKDLSSPVKSGVFLTNYTRDYTVKVDVRGLASGVQYYYGFAVYGSDSIAGAAIPYKVESPVGNFRLPYPEGSDKQKKLRYAVYSCSNWGWGYFNAYDAGSRYDLDFWIHLGDYIYEYGILTYPSPAEAVRWQDPAGSGLTPSDEIVSLYDYRKRHALYRSDPGLQALSAKAPLLSIWDDHEITNNARTNTAQNHQSATEGEYQSRKENARKAYYEWMPIREIEDGDFIGFKLNKTLSYGNLAKFFLLEERVTGRTDEPVPTSSTDESTFKYGTSLSTLIGAVVDNKTDTNYTPAEVAALKQIKAASDAVKNNENSTVAGPEQLEWVRQETEAAKAAGVTWAIYNHGTPFFERYTNYEAAIEQMRKISPSRAATWERYYNAIVKGEGEQMVTSEGMQCYNRLYYKKPLPVSPTMRISMRRTQAAAKFKIMTGFDAYQGSAREREQFLSIVSSMPNVVQYGGDSHAEWAGLQMLNGKTVLAEFDVGSVTSPSSENGAYLPLDFIRAANVAGSYEEGLRYSYVGEKGFMLIELTEETHHTEYVHVDNWCTPDYKVKCAAAFDYFSTKYKGSKPRKELVNSSCSPPPKGRPYEKLGSLNTLMGQQYSYVRR